MNNEILHETNELIYNCKNYKISVDNIYFLGGSPCSGKSTLAELLTSKYNYQYFKLDDRLGDYTEKGKMFGKPYLTKYCNMSSDEIWLRLPEEQKIEEIAIYKEMFEYALSEIDILPKDIPIIAEGAGFMPELMKSINVMPNKYVCMVPTKEFQCKEYPKRSWIPYVLAECSDKELAFKNWMERDVLFAIDVYGSANHLGYPTILVDGNTSIEENLKIVEKIFIMR